MKLCILSVKKYFVGGQQGEDIMDIDAIGYRRNVSIH